MIRTAPEPAPTASPPGDATTQHTAPAITCEEPCVAPLDDPEAADDEPAEANEARELPAQSEASELPAEDEASELPAESEARRAMEAAARLAAEDEARLALERALERELKFWADRSGQRAAELAARRATEPDADARAEPAGRPVAGPEASPRLEGNGAGAAILAALALAATAVALLIMHGIAGGLVSAPGSEDGLSDRKPAGASERVAGIPGAGVGPVIAPPAPRTAPAVAAPALVARDPARAEAMVVIPAAILEAFDAGSAPAAPPSSASETSRDMYHDPEDRAEETGSVLPVGADAGGVEGATVADVVPAPPVVPTSAPRRAARPPRGRAPPPDRVVADDAPVDAPVVVPTSRDLTDAPVEVPASGE